MNAGAYGGDMADCLDWAEIVTRDGELVRLAAAATGLRLSPCQPAAGRRGGARAAARAARRSGA